MSAEMAAAISSSDEGFPGMPGATPTIRPINSLNTSPLPLPRSLVISPDLDALLEHEERTRMSPNVSPTSAWAPTFAATSTEFVTFTSSLPIGLPLPPRGPRRPRPPLTSCENMMNGFDPQCSPIEPNHPVQTIMITEAPPRYSQMDPGSMPSSLISPNPYINPPPTLQDIMLHVNENITPDRQSEDMTTSSVDQSRGRGRPHVSVDVSQSLGDTRLVDQRPQEQPKSPTSRVDRLLSKARNRFQDYSNSTEERPSSSSSSNSASSGGKGRRLLKLKTAVNGNRTQQAGNQGVRGQGSPIGDEATSRPGRRPLCLSHGVSSSPSSLDDSDGLTDSSYPLSTIDPRVSISSTIYFAPSAAYSNPPFSMHSPRNSPPPDHSRNSSPRRKNSDTQSFIEFSPERSESSRDRHPFYRMKKNGLASRPSSRSRSRSPQPSSLARSTLVPRPANPGTPSRSTSPTTHNRTPDLTLKANGDNLPPTTNFLDVDERADLIRKSRKLAQLFGQPLGPDVLARQDPGRNLRPNDGPSGRSHHHQRQALSVSIADDDAKPQRHKAMWPPEGTKYMSANGRRHSSPLTPDEFSFLSEVPSNDSKMIGLDSGSESDDTHKGDNERERRKQTEKNVARASMTSFMDLSDEEAVDTHRSGHPAAHHPSRRPSSPSYQSMYENMTPEEQAEEDRRKKREKLARLHRFLGSRVPPDLVLGIDIPPAECMLPPAAFDSAILGEDDPNSRKAWMKRRRSSSAAAFSSTWSDTLDRLKEDLNEKEKAINVRRAQKMEKVFGVAPPQGLYHTRHSPAPSSNTPAGRVPGYTNLSDAMSTSVANVRNFNRSAYIRPVKKHTRPGTSESSRHLLPKGQDVNESVGRTSAIYSHYQYSLNSLNDIIDRDDRASLAELHEYLHKGDVAGPSLDRHTFTASSKERRRSLPVRTSLLSLSSEYSITSPKPEVTDFQLRRRRAAKLTQFFGVDYTELISDVLESIENGLEHERTRGTLNTEEVEDLLVRLRDLRIKREGVL
ncbi:hypothetical protein BDN72DRAFT_47418 [Pluteus cervinus]|uniref:Uncharacterized protein n=1 Tax=Pluteus cervinus TaxID=181527 RepID=A0ACD3BHB6_9AGAR|nr:hypothetical protein BDN72DRAFT_47418 [Pluteus cervinus]